LVQSNDTHYFNNQAVAKLMFSSDSGTVITAWKGPWNSKGFSSTK
jgi:hypothetical protein